MSTVYEEENIPPYSFSRTNVTYLETQVQQFCIYEESSNKGSNATEHDETLTTLLLSLYMYNIEKRLKIRNIVSEGYYCTRY